MAPSFATHMWDILYMLRYHLTTMGNAVPDEARSRRPLHGRTVAHRHGDSSGSPCCFVQNTEVAEHPDRSRLRWDRSGWGVALAVTVAKRQPA